MMVDERSHKESLVNRVKEILTARLADEDFGVSELAFVLGVSRSQLHRKMRKATGKSSSQFIREYRLKRGYTLLKQGKLSVSEVAYGVGFRNATYFHLCFRQHFGITPGELRRKGAGGSDEVQSNAVISNENQYAKTNSSLVYIGGGLAFTCFFLIALVQPLWPVDAYTEAGWKHMETIRDSSAYMHYLQGEHLRLRNQPDAHREAIAHYKEAIARDSLYLQAYLGLADIYIQGGSYWGEQETKEAWANAREVLQQGLNKMPGEPLIEEQLLTGYFNFERDLNKAESLYHKHMVGNNPVLHSYPLALEYALKTGRLSEALTRINLELTSNPAAPRLYLLKARALLLSGEVREARQILYAYRTLFSDNYYYLIESCRLFIFLEDYAQAEYFLQLYEERFKERPPVILWVRAEMHRYLGKSEKAMHYVHELEWRHQAETAGSPAWFLALFYARQGDLAAAMDWLRQSFAQGETELTWMMQEPWLKPLHEETTFQDLYQALGYHEIKR